MALNDTKQQIHSMLSVSFKHRHIRIIDCLTAHTACLVCFISTVNGHNKKEEKKAIMGCASSGHITKLKQSILPFNIYGFKLLLSYFKIQGFPTLNAEAKER
jgi:hypothetical protein